MKRPKQPPFLSPAVMRRAFQARLLSVDPQARRVTRVAIQYIGGFEDKSYKIRYRLSLLMRGGQRRQLIVRGSSEWADQTRRQAYVIMRYLWLHGFSSGPWQIARPITFFLRWRLLVYQESLGVNLLTVLRRPRVQAGPYLERAAEWLAHLHAHSPRTLRLAYNQAGRKHYWLMALNVLSTVDEREAAALRRSIDGVMKFEDVLAGGQNRVLVHHDFHLANILVLPQTIRVVDFTESRLSSPIIDVAAFCIQLELLLSTQVRLDKITQWQKIFLRAYQRRAPDVNLDSPAAKRIIRFVRYRIALQSFVGSYLFGQPAGRLKQTILSTHWYYG